MAEFAREVSSLSAAAEATLTRISAGEMTQADAILIGTLAVAAGAVAVSAKYGPAILKKLHAWLGRSAPKGAPTALRRVGDLLESAHDVMANPSLLQGKSMAQVRMMIDKTPGWANDVMRHSTTHPKGGWVFREMNAAGTDFTGRMIQFNPGTPRHFGGQAYWKVSGVPGQKPMRIPVSP